MDILPTYFLECQKVHSRTQCERGFTQCKKHKVQKTSLRRALDIACVS